MRYVMMAAAWLVFCAPVAAQQTVYKCERDGTTVYSQQPCAKPGSAAMEQAPMWGDHQPSADTLQRVQRRKQERDAKQRARASRTAVRQCVNRLAGATRQATKRKIEAAQQQIAQIRQERVWYDSRSTTQATYAQTFVNGQNERIAALQASIDRARMRRTQAVSSARSTCAAQQRSAPSRHAAANDRS